MGLTTVTVTGVLKDAAGNLLKGKRLTFAPLDVFGDDGAVVATTPITVTSDASTGAFSTSLQTSDLAGAYVRYVVTFHTGAKKLFDLTDDSPVQPLEDLINAFDGAAEPSAAAAIADHEARIDALELTPPGSGAVIISAGASSGPRASLVFGPANGVTFGLSGSTITASHNALTDAAAFIASGASSGFVQSGVLTNYRATSADSQLRFTSADGDLRFTSADSQLRFTSADTQLQFTSANSLFQAVSDNSLSLGTAATASLLFTSQSSLFQRTADNSLSLGTGATVSFRHTSADSQLRFTSADSQLRFTSADSQLQFTSNNSLFQSAGAYLTTAMQSNAATISNIKLSAGASSANLSAVTFSNANGVSFGLNGSVMTGSVAAAGGAQTGISGISGGTTQMTSGTASFANSNGVSFGVNGNTITASHNGLTSQSVQTQNAVSVQGSTGAVSFANSNGITFGGNASTITASHNGLTSQSNQAFSASGGSSSFQTLNFANSNGFTFSNSNGSIIASYTVPAAGGGSVNISAGTTSQNLTNLVFSNSNAVSFGLSGSTITGSIPGSSSLSATGAVSVSVNGSTISIGAPVQTNQQITAYGVSNTTQATSGTLNASNLSFQGAGGVSVGVSNGSVVISGATGGAGGGVALYDGANSITSGTARFSNANNVSFGFNGQTITGSVPATSQISGTGAVSVSTNGSTIFIGAATGAAGGGIANAAGTQTATSGTVGFANSNGITFGMSGSSQITASHNALTSQSVQTQGMVSINGGTGDISFSNSNGITFGRNASTITASHNGITSQTVQTQNAVSVQGSTGAISFSNSNGVSFGFNASTITASHNGLTSQSNQAFSAAGGASAFQTLSFGNSNGLTFSNSNGSVVASYTVPTQSNQTQGFYAVGNTTQSTSGTQDARSLTFSGAGNVSVGFSGGSYVISGGTAAPSPVNFSAGTTSGNLGSVVLSNSNGISFGLNGSTITGSVPATSSLSATGKISISANASTISIGAKDEDLQYFEVDDVQGMGLMTNVTAINTTPIFVPFILKGNLTNSSMILQVSRSTSGSNAFTVQAGIYSYVNGTQISLMGSLQNAYSGGNTASISGVRYLKADGWQSGVTAMTPGAYVMALNFSAGATASMNYSLFGGLSASQPVGFIGSGTDANTTTAGSSGPVNFWGRYTAGSAALPSTVAQSQLLAGFTGASQPLAPWFVLRS